MHLRTNIWRSPTENIFVSYFFTLVCVWFGFLLSLSTLLNIEMSFLSRHPRKLTSAVGQRGRTLCKSCEPTWALFALCSTVLILIESQRTQSAGIVVRVIKTILRRLSFIAQIWKKQINKSINKQTTKRIHKWNQVQGNKWVHGRTDGRIAERRTGEIS